MALLVATATPDAGTTTTPPSAGAALARAVAFFGGAAAIRAHATQVTTYDVVLADGTKGRRTTWVRCPDKAREELAIGGRTWVVGSDGATTWRWAPGGARPTQSAQLQATVRTTCLAHALLAAADGATARIAADGDVEIGAPGARFRVRLAGDGRPTRLAWAGDGGDVVVDLDAWAPSDGRPAPRRVVVAVPGAQSETRRVVTVGVNARLADGLFAPVPMQSRPAPDDDAIDL